MSPEAEKPDAMEDASGQPGGKRGDRSTNAQQKAPPANQQGLAPTDLTALPEESRELITWLARRKMATLDEIAQAFCMKRGSIANMLEELLAKGHVRETILEGGKFYRVVFHAKPRRGPQGLGEELWDRLDFDEGEP